MSDTPEKPLSDPRILSTMARAELRRGSKWTSQDNPQFYVDAWKALLSHADGMDEKLAVTERQLAEAQKRWREQEQNMLDGLAAYEKQVCELEEIRDTHVARIWQSEQERDSLQQQLAEAQQSCERHLEGARNIAVIGLGLSDPWDESSDGSDWTGTLLASAEARLLDQGKILADYQAADRETEHFIENLKLLRIKTQERLDARDAEVGRLREENKRLKQKLLASTLDERYTIYYHITPELEDLKRNEAMEPEGERLRAELTEWLTKNEIVSVCLDTPRHIVRIDCAKLPPRIKTVLRLWGSIFVEDREALSTAEQEPKR